MSIFDIPQRFYWWGRDYYTGNYRYTTNLSRNPWGYYYIYYGNISPFKFLVPTTNTAYKQSHNINALTPIFNSEDNFRIGVTVNIADKLIAATRNFLAVGNKPRGKRVNFAYLDTPLLYLKGSVLFYNEEHIKTYLNKVGYKTMFASAKSRALVSIGITTKEFESMFYKKIPKFDFKTISAQKKGYSRLAGEMLNDFEFINLFHDQRPIIGPLSCTN
jgi:hypothetical protein